MRLEQLTFSRFVAAIAIVVFHYGRDVYPFNLPSLNFIFSQANIGVSYFFILSGFIMIIAYNKADKLNPNEYFMNRFARIYPLVFLSVIPFVLAAIFLSGESSLSDALLNLTTFQAWIPGKALAGNFPLWSITAEVFFYLCFPFLLNKFYKRYSLLSVAAVVAAIWIMSLLVQHLLLYHYKSAGFTATASDFIYYFPIFHLNQFLAGNLAGLFFIKQPQTSKGRFDLHVLLIFIVLLLLLKYNLPVSYHNGFLAIVFVPLIYYQGANKGWLSKMFTNQFFVFLGEISFAVYVLQVPVFEIVNEVAGRLPASFYLNKEILFYLKTTVLIVTASVSYLYIEKPLRNKIKAIRIKAVEVKTN